jgi:hypothetical protein
VSRHRGHASRSQRSARKGGQATECPPPGLRQADHDSHGAGLRGPRRGGPGPRQRHGPAALGEHRAGMRLLRADRLVLPAPWPGQRDQPLGHRPRRGGDRDAGAVRLPAAAHGRPRWHPAVGGRCPGGGRHGVGGLVAAVAGPQCGRIRAGQGPGGPGPVPVGAAPALHRGDRVVARAHAARGQPGGVGRLVRVLFPAGLPRAAGGAVACGGHARLRTVPRAHRRAAPRAVLNALGSAKAVAGRRA